VVDFLDYSVGCNSSSAPINLDIESSMTPAPITNIVDSSNSSVAVSFIVVDSRNNSTIITSVLGDNNNPTFITEVLEGNSTPSINSVARDSNDIVLKNMHGIVNLHDNNLPTRYSYQLPADYQKLLSQYCDIYNQGLYRSELEIITQLGDLRKRICDFISFVQEHVFDKDILSLNIIVIKQNWVTFCFVVLVLIVL